MNKCSPHMIRVAIVVGAVLALSGCDTLRDAAGMGKMPPDEFAVLTKAPLVVPPDFNLMPPKPGAAPTNQTDPNETAESALFGNDPAAIASNMTGNYSDGEKLLLANAGVQNTDPNIRIHLQSDRKAMLGADDTFTNDLLFWKGPKTDPGKAVDADAEARRIAAQKSGDTSGATPVAPNPAEPKKDEDKGLLDGWFDWF